MAYTLATLKTAIQDYTQNTETTFVSQLPRFIINSEERIFKSVQLDVFRKYQTGTLSQGSKFLTKPDDYLSSMSLSILENGDNKFLLYKHVTFLQDYAPNPNSLETPLYYGDWNDTSFMVAPTPSSDIPVELHYFFRPTSLTEGADSGETWLSKNASTALLYSCLLEGYTYMKGEQDMMSVYNTRYETALARLKVLGEGRDRKDAYRSGQLINPVS